MNDTQVMERIVTEARQSALAYVRSGRNPFHANAEVLGDVWELVKDNRPEVQQARRATVMRVVLGVLKEKGILKAA